LSIIKRRYTSNFTTIDNSLFEDERLAADEVGILAYLRSRPHDWEVRRPALARRWNMGRDAIKRVISNLVRTGWCVARKDRLPNGTFYMIYEIRDEPGPTLTDEDVRRAFSLVSSEAASDESDVISSPNIAGNEQREGADPPTPYPSLADPSPGDPEVAYKDIQNKDLPRTDSTQKPEREGARAREKHALNLVEFKRRWPTNASDDQAGRRAWYGLSNEEGEAALAGIARSSKT
jgi:predicted transcriptional regulator